MGADSLNSLSVGEDSYTPVSDVRFPAYWKEYILHIILILNAEIRIY